MIRRAVSTTLVVTTLLAAACGDGNGPSKATGVGQGGSGGEGKDSAGAGVPSATGKAMPGDAGAAGEREPGHTGAGAGTESHGGASGTEDREQSSSGGRAGGTGSEARDQSAGGPSNTAGTGAEAGMGGFVGTEGTAGVAGLGGSGGGCAPEGDGESGTACATTASIGPEGGQVTSPSGTTVIVPSDAFQEPASVSVRPLPTSSINVPDLPSGFALLAAAEIGFSTPPSQPVELTVPAPDTTGLDAFLVARVLDATPSRLVVVDSASVDGDRLMSNCPPFPGIGESGTYAFVGVPTGTSLAMFYTKATGNSVIAGALVEVAGTSGAFLGISASDGFAAVPVPTGSTPQNAMAVASDSAGTLLATLQPVVPQLVPLPIPTVVGLIADRIVDLLLGDLGIKVEDLPKVPAPCGLSVAVQPNTVPPAGSAPFKVGDSPVQLEVACTSSGSAAAIDCTKAGSSSSNIAAQVASMPITGYEMMYTHYRTSAPVSVLDGLVSATATGSGEVRVDVTLICYRKQEIDGYPSVLAQRSFSSTPVPVTVCGTCAAAGANCGAISDGCGGTLDCGSCAAPETCGGGGVPSRCGSPSGPSAGCGKVSTLHNGTNAIEVDGTSRTYVLQIPADYDTNRPYPLVVSPNPGSVPTDPPDGSSIFVWYNGAAQDAFMQAILEQVEADLCVDTTRVELH